MKSLHEILQLLNLILESPPPKKEELIKVFQDAIWNDESIQDERLNEILSDIAYDLDFYEPDEEKNKESPNFYGDERLKELLKSSIRRIEKYS